MAEELRGDREVVSKAVKQDGWALQYASDELSRSTAMTPDFLELESKRKTTPCPHQLLTLGDLHCQGSVI